VIEKAWPLAASASRHMMQALPLGGRGGQAMKGRRGYDFVDQAAEHRPGLEIRIPARLAQPQGREGKCGWN